MVRMHLDVAPLGELLGLTIPGCQGLALLIQEVRQRLTPVVP